MLQRSVVIVVILSLFPAAAFAITLNLTYPTIGGFNLADADTEGLGEVVGFLYALLVSISGILAFGMIIWGGIVWLTSAGNPARIADAVDRIQNALLGLLLILLSFALLQLINPDLTIITSPGL